MAKNNKLVKSKTLYTIRKKHATVSGGTVYENDYVTILPDDGIYDDEMALFSASNFKYKIPTGVNQKKRHIRGEFIKTADGDSAWTISDVSSHTISDESTIVLKPDYSSLKDFAYYGSAVALINATVNDIILRFPGGLCYYGEDAPVVHVGDDVYYLVSNEFQIDCWTGGGSIASGSIQNPMRILAASYMNYETANGDPITIPSYTGETECLNSIVGSVDFGAGIFQVYMDGEGEKHLISKNKGASGEIIIKPKDSFVNEFWKTMDDFEKVLLNRDTTPVYKATFDTPYTTETGYYYRPQQYVWPTVGDNGFTPDITTGKFQGYLSSLLSLATFHDTYDSDNIWRMMTHESLKNLDWSFVTNQNGEEVELTDIDGGRFTSMLRIMGRQFDDLKRYADNIKASNAISYDEKDNIPDYFLSDVVDINGWEAQNVAPFTNELTDTICGTTKTGTKYVYEKSGKTPSYVNSAFLRRLALSSTYIQSMKGTRRGIEAILGMFGYEPATEDNNDAGTYTITEYVDLVQSAISYCEASKYRVLAEYANYDDNTNYMDGYPVVPIIPAGEDVNTQKDINKWYLMPWFDKDATYRNPFYFQGKGGWGKQISKAINLPSLTPISAITPSDTVSIYEETLPYMRYASTIEEMLSMNSLGLQENTVCYVTDISPMMETGFYSKRPGDKEDEEDYSHYFVLKNPTLSSFVGYVSNNLYDCYGWRNVYLQEIHDAYNLNNTQVDTWEDGLRVLYMESLQSEEKGNNPHVGFGQYDDGDEYLENFRNLFKAPFEEGLFDYLNSDDEEYKEYYNTLANGYGFKFEEVSDNTKCSYFNDMSDDEEEGLKPTDFINYSGGTSQQEQPTDWNWAKMNDGTANVYNPESEETNDRTQPLDESCANSIVNVKKLTIRFNTGNNDEMKKYIQDVVLKYLEPMIPSTTILEYKFDNQTRAIAAVVPNVGAGTLKIVNAAHAAVENNNTDVINWMGYPTPIKEITND